MKNRTYTKFCGITNVQDAFNAQAAGCNSLGFVFVKKSKRYIEPIACQKILELLSPTITTVALFANNSVEEIECVIKSCKVHVLQFHGNESPEFCQQWNLPYWKAVPMADGVNPIDYANDYPDAQAYLIDNYGTKKSGGSGEKFDWDKLPSKLGNKWILAGGLDPENIRQAVRQTKLSSFDVSSGIEKSSGIKSNSKMINFIKNLND